MTPRPLTGPMIPALVALLAASAAAAQQPAPPPKPALSAQEPHTKAATAAKPAAAHSPSYILGVVTVEQMVRTGLPAAELDQAAYDQGMHDALAGKAESSEAVHAVLDKMVRDYSDENKAAAEKFLAANAKKPGVVTTPSGLQYKVVREGSGEQPKPT